MIDFNNPGFRMKENMIVTTFWEYLEAKKGSEVTEDEHEEFIEKNYAESELIKEIIALQVSHFILRRTNCLCGSNIDAIKSLLNQKFRAYKETTGREFKDYNEHVRF